MSGENFKPYLETFEKDWKCFTVESEHQETEQRAPTIELDGEIVAADAEELRILLDEHMAMTASKMVTK
jgi:hypothetical protein